MNQITISSDSDSDASMFASSTTTNRHTNAPHLHSQSHPRHHQHHHYQPATSTANNPSSSTTTPHISTDKRKRTTHRAHETIHISNTILSSKELLLLHSLAANESVPRTRRRFMAQVIEPDDPLQAAKLLWDHSVSSSVGGGATAVGGLQFAAGNIVDVVETDDRNGWERLRVRKSTGSGGGGGGSPRTRTTSSPGGTIKGQRSRVVSGSQGPSRSGSPLASPVVRRGRREDGDGDVDMDIY